MRKTLILAFAVLADADDPAAERPHVGLDVHSLCVPSVGEDVVHEQPGEDGRAALGARRKGVQNTAVEYCHH